MATIIVRLCDRHQDKGENVEAEARTVALDPFLTYELDLCPPCWDDLTNGLAEAVTKWGSRATGIPAPKPQRRRRNTVPPGEDPNGLEYLTDMAAQGIRRGVAPVGPRDYQCFWCPLSYAGLGGMLGHAETLHGLPDHRVTMFGDRCPVCNDVQASGRGGSLAQHGATMHPPAQNTIQLFHMAAAMGDPHGIVAKVLAMAEVKPGGIVIAKGA